VPVPVTLPTNDVPTDNGSFQYRTGTLLWIQIGFEFSLVIETRIQKSSVDTKTLNDDKFQVLQLAGRCFFLAVNFFNLDPQAPGFGSGSGSEIIKMLLSWVP
jgi:hypothetical protein